MRWIAGTWDSKDKRVTPDPSVSGQTRIPNMGIVGPHLVFYYYHSDTNKKNSAPSYPSQLSEKWLKILSQIKIKWNVSSEMVHDKKKSFIVTEMAV